MQLLDGLCYYPWVSLTENNCNSYLIDAGIPTVIDVGLLRHLKRLYQSMGEDGMQSSTIGMVISTHLHPDHHEGISAFSASNAVVAFHREEARHLTAFGHQIYDAMHLPIPSIKPTCYLTEGTLRLGRENIEVYHTPGHSPGSISLYWKDKRALFCGDVLFFEGVGRTDFYEGDSVLLKDSISRLSQLDVEYLLPGHGRIIQGKEGVAENFLRIREKIFPLM